MECSLFEVAVFLVVVDIWRKKRKREGMLFDFTSGHITKKRRVSLDCSVGSVVIDAGHGR